MANFLKIVYVMIIFIFLFLVVTPELSKATSEVLNVGSKVLLKGNYYSFLFCKIILPHELI